MALPLFNLAAWGSASFLPSQLSGLKLWLKADALSLNDGDPIGTWADSSGNGNDATGTTTQRPTFKTAILNSKPVARFNGTSNGLATPSINLTATSAITIFLVASAASSGDQIWAEFSTNKNSFTDGFAFFRSSSSNFVDADFKGDVGLSVYLSGRIVTTRHEVVSAVMDKTITNAVQGVAGYGYRESIVYIGGLQAGGSNSLDTQTQSNNTNAFGTYPLYIGARNKSSLFVNGDIAEVLLYNHALTDAERKQVDLYLIQKYARQHTNGTLAMVGDSMTAGTSTSSPYPQQLNTLLVADGYDFNWGNFGMSGWTCSDMSAAMLSKVTPYAGIDGNKNIAVVWGGTNDLHHGVSVGTGVSAAVAESNLWAVCDTIRAAGYKVIVLTCLPRSDTNTPAGFEAARGTLNTAIRANYTSHADALYDPAANTTIGDAGDETNATNYVAGNVHLNNTGQAIIAAGLKPLVEAF